MRNAATPRWGLVLLLLGLTLGCSPSPPAPPAPAAYALPFGLRHVDGTSAAGRPASYEDVLLLFKGEPVRGRRLRAAYVVTGKDPVAVFQEWVDQLAVLPLDELAASPGDVGAGQWLVASGSTAYRAQEPFGAYAQLQLWRTGAGPVLLVDVSVRSGAAPASPPPVVVPATPRPGTEVPDEQERAGDVLFTEQDQAIHFPEGTRALVPTLPTPQGTGGSSSVLAADDADAAVRALLDEAMGGSDHAEVRGPTVSVEEGVRTVRASFTIPAGGWSFDVVATQGEGDEEATLFVASAAD